MSDDGTLKDDVRLPEGDVGDKIVKLFRTDEKDTSMFIYFPSPPPLLPFDKTVNE